MSVYNGFSKAAALFTKTALMPMQFCAYYGRKIRILHKDFPVCYVNILLTAVNAPQFSPFKNLYKKALCPSETVCGSIILHRI